MNYLVDTNVLSELQKRRPHPAADALFRSVADPQIFLSVLTIGELRRGHQILLRKDAHPAMRLQAWIDNISLWFAGRILDVDLQTALIWGEPWLDRASW